MEPRSVGERLEEAECLDRYAEPLHRVVLQAIRADGVKNALHGVWLGHPLHPLLTDLPIGFWTSSMALDLLGGRAARPAADALIGFGLVTALPTAAAGAADWSALNTPERRTGLVHGLSNASATVLYSLSLVARRRGRRGTGLALSLAGAAAATVGGYLGGHLTFRRGAGVNRAAEAPSPDEWTSASIDDELSDQRPVHGEVDGEPLVVVGLESGPVALFARCSHLGGPLDEGELTDGCVRCPWHGSVFDLADGAVVTGPATAPQPAYEVRVTDGEVSVRRR